MPGQQGRCHLAGRTGSGFLVLLLFSVPAALADKARRGTDAPLAVYPAPIRQQAPHGVGSAGGEEGATAGAAGATGNALRFIVTQMVPLSLFRSYILFSSLRKGSLVSCTIVKTSFTDTV